MYTSNDFLEDNDVFLQFSPTFHQHDDSFFQSLPPLPPQQELMESPKDPCMLHSAASSNGKFIGRLPKRRSGKKDRHSKIVTAQGTRDRRMRLSLEISRKFFNLQDMLGFDKASKTVEWLMTQSKQAMDDLSKASGTGDTKITVSSTSECDVVSEIDEGKKGYPSKKCLEVSNKPSCKTSFHLVAKDLRVKARERARQRTLEKNRKLDKPKLYAVQEGHQLKPLSSFRRDDESGDTESNILKYSLKEPVSSPKPQCSSKDVASRTCVNNTVSASQSSGINYQNNFVSMSNSTTTTNNNLLPYSWGADVGKMQQSYCGNPSTGNLQYPINSSIFMSTIDGRLQSYLMDINQFYAKPWDP